MKFTVIQGGLAEDTAPAERENGSLPGLQDVLREAERRIGATGYQKWRNRETATGLPVPRDVQYVVMQIRYVAEAISRLSRIPADFRSDIYWPAEPPALTRVGQE